MQLRYPRHKSRWLSSSSLVEIPEEHRTHLLFFMISSLISVVGLNFEFPIDSCEFSIRNSFIKHCV